MRVIGLILVAALASAGPAGRATAASELVETVQMDLYVGDSAAAMAAIEEKLTQSPDDDEARFLLGGVQFIQAIEGFGQGLYRYGITSAHPRRSGMALLPLFRIPIPQNPEPEKIDYEKLRGVLARLVDNLGVAEATLATAGHSPIEVSLNIGLIRLDLNGDGVGSADEALSHVLSRVARMRRSGDNDPLLVDFDSSDVPWLQAYCNLLMALAEFPLAHDWHTAFEATFHELFPSADLPLSHAPLAEDKSGSFDFGGVADLIAFVHLNHWPVVEPDRMRRVLMHLEAIPPLSRENWRRILAETDDNNEWIPNPQQTGALGISVSQEVIDGWLAFLDDFEALLQGKKLLGHWRFTQGINLRRMFLEPTTFDIVLLIQGSAALPYLEDGEIVDQSSWRRMTLLFGGNFFRYAVWFN
jgi:hypothetical protein